LYIPEYMDPADPASLVIVLHGGTGHGADFLWSWLREARTRGFVLLAPTSQSDTWALMGEDIDLGPLTAMIDFIKQQCSIDEDHILLTGMSDGGTYTLQAGLHQDSPFTHLAPFSGVLHPEIQMMGRMQHARDRDIYLVHGTLDWMFPIETAYMAQAELEAAGANLVFRPIEGLSHSYCRAENPNVISWFNRALEIPKND
jgi:phospholipase/carboxylesterase